MTDELQERIKVLEKFCQDRVDDIEILRTALHIVREYPDFDGGGPIPSMIDDVLMGRKSVMVESYDYCSSVDAALQKIADFGQEQERLSAREIDAAIRKGE